MSMYYSRSEICRKREMLLSVVVPVGFGNELKSRT